jgi:glucose-6-phosphate isomerase
MLSIQFDSYITLRGEGFFEEQALLATYDPSLITTQGFVEMLYQPTTDLQLVIENFRHFSTILFVGLGGSSLGPKMLYEALHGSHTSKQVLFIDTVDPSTITTAINSIQMSDTLVIIVSKSGNTPETIGLYHFFERLLTSSKLTPQDHMLILTDQDTGYLRKQINAYNYKSLSIPTRVGGRFSVLSPVGLVLSELIGLDTKQLISGATTMHKSLTTPNALQNSAFKLAMLLYFEYSSGKNILVLFTYADRLKGFGDWCVQLIAESLGKKNRYGASIGITPHGARGVADQHSQLQLFADGPDDKVYMMIKPVAQATLEIPSIQDDQFAYLSQIEFATLLNAEFEATFQSLSELGRPMVKLFIDELCESDLGEMILLMEAVTLYLGTILDIDPLNQPGVERSKLLTKELLSKPRQ